VKLRYFLVLLILVAAGTVSFLHAQQAPKKLTLEAALERAQMQNLDLLAARAQRAVAEAGVRVAGQRPNPTAFFGALRDTPHESLFFDQAVEIGPKRGRRIEVARRESALTNADITEVERQVRRSVRDAYFALAHARGATSQRTEALRLAERLQGIARVRFEAGDIPQLEVTQADLEVARAQGDVAVAQQEEKVALSDLNALLDEPATTNWELGDALTVLPPTRPLEELLARAGASNAEVARVLQEEKVQQSRTSLLRAERIPNLGLEFGTDFNAPGPDGFRVGPRGQVSIEVPLFSRNQGQIAQSLAKERALEGQLAAARRAVDARVESAYFDLEARRTQAQLYRDELLPSSKRLEEMAEESYRAGKANILTVLGAQRDVQQVERNYLDSLQATQSAFAQLEEAVGVPLE
jgi:cobalt-zinc-cadmium efflux system outer membrane protein